MKGAELSVVTAPDQALVDDLTALLDRAARATGHAALSEHKRTALLHTTGGASSGVGEPRLVAVVVARTVRPTGLAGCAPVVGDESSHRYAVEPVVEPSAADPTGILGALLDTAVDLVARLGGGDLRLWIPTASRTDDERARIHGFRVERSLIQMRCPLPLPGGRRREEPGHRIRTRPFRPGLDEETWLTANNRAFEGHPEQGNWDLATLLEREKEPWFDPDGLLVLEADGRVAGSCWTKIHADTDPPMGEIYVIVVDPEFHGRGWGRALTEAGLDWLAGRGLTTGMLYVDAENVAAVSMYRSMGFVDDHVDRSYVQHIG